MDETPIELYQLRQTIKRQLFHGGDEPVRLGRFTILERLGEGGMGVVFACYDPTLDRRVAIKVLNRELGELGERQRLRTLREAQAQARLSHPNVIAVYEVGELDGSVFIVMEFVRGATLKAWLAAAARPVGEVLAVLSQAGRGLAAAHRAGLVHRDFKPKSRRTSPTAPQPTDRPHSHDLGRFERVDVGRGVPQNAGTPQVLAKGWQRSGPADDARVLTLGLCVPATWHREAFDTEWLINRWPAWSNRGRARAGELGPGRGEVAGDAREAVDDLREVGVVRAVRTVWPSMIARLLGRAASRRSWRSPAWVSATSANRAHIPPSSTSC